MNRYSNTTEIYHNSKNLSEENCKRFQIMYDEYMAGRHELASALADAYMYGKGTDKDYKKAIRVLVDTAYEYFDLNAIRALSDYFYIGEGVSQNITLALYLNDIVNKKQIKSMNQYKADKAKDMSSHKAINNPDREYLYEVRHLRDVLNSIRNNIRNKNNAIVELDRDTSWMDRDQRMDWLNSRVRNSELYREIAELEKIERRPYYGRIDVAVPYYRANSVYIGENSYSDRYIPALSISSVWSEFGAHFRDSRTNRFTLNGQKVDVLLRRKYIIENGELIEYYDEYNRNTNAGRAEITDPYLLHVLEEKRGEKNITNIIRTIQDNQNEIIEKAFNSNIIVQGCAGSGKTMILLHRLANLKYNNMNYDWNNVRIITPNQNFTLYIDELSKDLKIDEIEKLTLAEYYMELIQQFREQFPERINRNGEIEITPYRKYNEENERKRMRKDGEWEKIIVAYIYSNEFKDKLNWEATVLKAKTQGNLTFGSVWSEFDDILHAILWEKFHSVKKGILNYNCILYAKVLFLFNCLGKIRKNVKMLCIDEGQDIADNQYVLLYEVNGKNTCFNIYGDLAQRISSNENLSDWRTLQYLLDADYYELNENYRNSEEIITFYNKQLAMKNKSFGLSTKPVEWFNQSELDILVKLQLLLKNRTVIITKDKSVVPASIMNLCKQSAIEENRVSVMDVKEVKGLEFDTAFVFDLGMDYNDKYISYTRALSELYIQSKSGANGPALGL